MPLLLSGQLYDNFSSETQQKCRHLDTVLLEDVTKEPIRVMTCDVIADFLEPEEDQLKQTMLHEKRMRVRQRIERNKYKDQIFSGEIQASELFQTDPDLEEMTQFFHHDFIKKYEDGIALYLEGYWPEAKVEFEKVSRIKGFDDRPTQNLLRFMRKTNFIAPADWKNYSLVQNYIDLE